MKHSWSLGPVFAFESVVAARRPQMYVGRALYVFSLLIGLGLIWAPAGQTFHNGAVLERIASNFLMAVVAIQLAVVALAAPAATAGAICVDKTRGTLLHAFVTDLTGREIVLGKLASRMASILALMACGLPVLALSSLLGGIDLIAALGAYLVTLGVAVVGCALTVLFSVWARKPHQALLPSYALLGLWGGFLPGIIVTFQVGAPPTWPPWFWLVALTNPICCAFGPSLDPTRDMLAAQAAFLGMALLFSFLLVAQAARAIRPVVVGQSSRPARVERTGFAARLIACLPEPPLDGNPVLWREWHRKRPTRWVGRLWTAYALVSILANVLALLGVTLMPWLRLEYVLGLVNAWEVSIGLLLLSASAPLALGEERDRGSLDIIMTTPLPTSTIVWGKWLGTFATVPRLAILPIAMTAVLALDSGNIIGLVAMVGIILVPAAAITSLGLALATWMARPGRAVAVSLLAYVFLSIGLGLLVSVFEDLYRSPPFPLSEWTSLRYLSPFHAVYRMTTVTSYEIATLWSSSSNMWSANSNSAIFYASELQWVGVAIQLHALVALVLLALTLQSFDRMLGRISPDSNPVGRALASQAPGSPARGVAS